jgi:hypothetical protein
MNAQAKGLFTVFHCVECAPKLAEALRVAQAALGSNELPFSVQMDAYETVRAALAEWDNGGKS